MDDEKEIIYIALCNSLRDYESFLEEEDIDAKERELTQYLIKRHLELIDKYADEIDKSKTIQRPQW